MVDILIELDDRRRASLWEGLDALSTDATWRMRRPTACSCRLW